MVGVGDVGNAVIEEVDAVGEVGGRELLDLVSGEGVEERESVGVCLGDFEEPGGGRGGERREAEDGGLDDGEVGGLAGVEAAGRGGWMRDSEREWRREREGEGGAPGGADGAEAEEREGGVEEAAGDGRQDVAGQCTPLRCAGFHRNLSRLPFDFYFLLSTL